MVNPTVWHQGPTNHPLRQIPQTHSPKKHNYSKVRAVDPTMLHILSNLAASQTHGTKATTIQMVLFLNYCATYPDAKLRYYRASDMILNGPILNISKVLKGTMSSAAEAEIGDLYLNAKEATVIRTTLTELGHPQPATPMETNSSTACGIMNRTVKQVQLKAIDMCFYWVAAMSSKDTLESTGHP
jgi:hypothetical protein